MHGHLTLCEGWREGEGGEGSRKEEGEGREGGRENRRREEKGGEGRKEKGGEGRREEEGGGLVERRGVRGEEEGGSDSRVHMRPSCQIISPHTPQVQGRFSRCSLNWWPMVLGNVSCVCVCVCVCVGHMSSKCVSIFMGAYFLWVHAHFTVYVYIVHLYECF